MIDQINSVLPQTQCGQCGFQGCKPYATALAEGAAEINQCPPGGDEGIRELSLLLRREYKPLAPEYGVEKPPSIALIDEQVCIGCTLCITACPVDAIIGASKQMHTVVTSLCTGCELCIPPCPVDCIMMETVTKESAREKWTREDKKLAANAARERYEFRQFREHRETKEKAARLAARLDLHQIEAKNSSRK